MASRRHQVDAIFGTFPDWRRSKLAEDEVRAQRWRI